MSNFVLETLTPLHIGSGGTLSPYGDYIYDAKTHSVYLIDQQKLFTVINEYGDSLMDEFVQKVGASSQHNQYTLKKFLEDYQIDFQSVSKAKIPARNALKSEQISELIKSGTRPYIPGSSIKGAVRTALLYAHRKEDGYSIEDALIDTRKKEAKNRKPSPNGEDLFGNIQNDVLKFLHISDTELLPEDDIEIVKTVRVNLVKKSSDIPMIKETIPKGKKLQFRLQVKAKKGYHELDERFSYLYQTTDAKGEGEILKMVNEFSEALIEKELKTLKNFSSPNLAPILQFYEGLLATCKQYKSKQNGAILRLGSGKTYFDNTISILFSDQEIEKLPLNRKGKGLFPKTRTVTDNQRLFGSVLGWVKILKSQE